MGVLDNSDMPRIARQIPQGAVVHIISRFVNRAYRLNTDAQRENYLSRVARVVSHTDWTLLGYALLSTHIHWAAVAGNKPLWQFAKPLHCGFARWLNITDSTFGPVFAERPSAFIV
ncbi:MAG: hypothetical protein MJE77_16360, partial [Proteobacteria bacterium]|nr:hypothetical protein [Pseudomonadota bacterium]